MQVVTSHTNDSPEVTRALTSSDLALLEEPRGIKPVQIKKIRDSHHLLARLVAMGGSLNEISVRTGYSISRISILRSDPTFAELVAFYRKHVEAVRDEVTRDFYQQLTALHGDIVDELQDRIHDEPELISTDSLLDMAKFTADRIGLAPVHKSQNLNLNVDLADRVAAGRQRALRLSAGSPAKQGQQVTPIEPAGPVDPEDENG